MTLDLQTLLNQAGVTLDQLTQVINIAGGRDPERPIIYHEKCNRCSSLFFSNSQDHHMRLNNGYPIHCPTCREDDRRATKRMSAKNRMKYVR